MSSLLERVLKNSTIKGGAKIEKSSFFGIRNTTPTDLPILNLAFSGELDGGFAPGLTVIAGESKSFKTLLTLYCMKAFLDRNKDGIGIIYDSEYGITPSYLKSRGIDTDRVLHFPVEDAEQLKFEMTKQLKELTKKDKVFIMIDSVGNLASKKEVEDAENEKSVADMSRAKSFKSFFRIITPYLTKNDIPCFAINHVYKEIGLYPKAIVSGGCMVEKSLIQTSEGLIEIQNLQVGDKVLTEEGYNEVDHIWTPDTLEEGTPVCYEIEFEDGSILTVSENHRFMKTDGEWIYVSELTENDALKVVGVNSLTEMKIVKKTNVGKKPVYDITVKNTNSYVTKNGIVSHNTGIMYSANQVFIITKSQEKTGTEVVGYNFTINIEKSRYVKEKSKLPFTVLFDQDIQKWSAMFDFALEAGFIEKVSSGWYKIVDPATGEVSDNKQRESAIMQNDEFFTKLINNNDFKQFLKEKFCLGAEKKSSVIKPDGDQEDYEESEEYDEE